MLQRLNNKKIKNGFTLLEVMAAVFVVTVGLIGIFIVIQNLSTYTAYAKDRLVASYLAQEGMEIIRNIRDTNWLERSTTPDNPWDEGLLTGCLNNCEVDYTTPTVPDPIILSYEDRNLKIDPNNGFYKYDCSGCPESKFTRKITITPDGTDALTVKVSVSWPKGKAEVLEKLYNWQEE